MDPDTNLDEQLQLAREITELADQDAEQEPREVRLAELVLALDEWLSRGGFKPSRWTREWIGGRGAFGRRVDKLCALMEKLVVGPMAGEPGFDYDRASREIAEITQGKSQITRDAAAESGIEVRELSLADTHWSELLPDESE